MNEDHKELPNRIWKKYLLILAFAFLLFMVLLTVNGVFSFGQKEIPKYSQNSFKKFKRIISYLQSIAKAIASVIQRQLLTNSLTNTQNLYCNSTTSYSECQNIQNEHRNSLTIQTIQNTSTSFRCRSGSCQEIIPLWDYFWVFKLRYNYINYLFVKYSVNNTHESSFIVPSLAVETININEVNTADKYNLLNGTFVLSKQIVQNTSIDISIILDKQVLQTEQGINLDTFEFTSSTFTQKPQQATYLQVSISLFRSFILIFVIGLGIVSIWLLEQIINHWEQMSFNNLQVVDSLYKYQMDSIVTGKLPHNSTILCQSSMTAFYQDLSYIIDKNSKVLTLTEQKAPKQEPLKYQSLLQTISSKFTAHIKKQQEERNSLIGDLKYQIKNAINQITETTNKKLKENFQRCKELRLLHAFFYFGYLSLLQSIMRYEQRIHQEKVILPQNVIELFRYINHSIHSDDIKFAFKFAFMYPKHIEQELIMKLQFYLLQKYLIQFKEFDVNLYFGKVLNIEQDIKYLQQSIDNKKYIFMTYLK